MAMGDTGSHEVLTLRAKAEALIEGDGLDLSIEIDGAESMRDGNL